MQLLALNNLFFLAIIPIIILFYLLKRKYENYQVSSNLLWDLTLRDLEAVKPWQKLKKNILLILQLLIAILLIFTLTRPAIPTEGIIANHTVLVIDSSASMLTVEEDKTRFQLAKEETKTIVNSLGSKQTISVIEMSNTPKIIIAHSSDKDALLTALESIEVRYGSADEIGTFSLAKSIASSETESGIIWLSDGANSDLDSLQTTLPTEIKFEHIQVGKIRENLSLSTFVTQEDAEQIRGLVRVDNNGSTAKIASLSIKDIDGNLLDTYSINVSGNDIYSIELKNLPNSDAYQAILDVENDGLMEDNQLWSVPYTNSEINVSIVSEEGNYFLNHALSINNIELEKMSELPLTYNQTTDLWIFDGVLPETLPEGNMLIIAPKNSQQTSNQSIEIVNAEHALLNYVSFSDVHINSYNSFSEIQGLETLVKIDDVPILLAGTYEGKRIVILTFDLQHSDFPLNTSFPILVQNIVEWLAPKQSVPIIVSSPEEKISIPLTIGATDRRLLAPSGTDIGIENNSLIATVTIPEEIGLYKLVENLSNEEITRYFSVGLNQAETSIIPENIVMDISSSTDEDSEIAQDGELIGYKELGKFFVFLALLISFVEWVVYKRGY